MTKSTSCHRSLVIGHLMQDGVYSTHSKGRPLPSCGLPESRHEADHLAPRTRGCPPIRPCSMQRLPVSPPAPLGAGYRHCCSDPPPLLRFAKQSDGGPCITRVHYPSELGLSSPVSTTEANTGTCFFIAFFESRSASLLCSRRTCSIEKERKPRIRC